MALRISVMMACLAGSGFGQGVPKFEVASIRVCRTGEVVTGRGQKKGGGGRVSASPGHLDSECQTAERLIRDAYLLYGSGKPWAVSTTTGLRIPPVSNREMNQEIRGAPGWISSERYTVNAKAESAEGNEMMRGPMMQALLEERFKLKIRRETAEVPVYELTVAKGGPKLPPAQKGGCIPIDLDHLPQPGRGTGQPLCGAVRMNAAAGTMEMSGVTIEDFCLQFSVFLDRELIDRTGIAGVYDFHLQLSPADLGMPDRRTDATDPPAQFVKPDPADIFVAVKGAVQKVGLRLESGKAPGNVLAIEHIERPSEN